MTLTTNDLIKAVSETVFPIQGDKTAESARESFEKGKHAVESILSVLQKSFANGDSVRLVGFGTFTVRQVPERQGRNPRTGNPITIQATKKISFKGGKTLVEALNGKETQSLEEPIEHKASSKLKKR